MIESSPTPERVVAALRAGHLDVRTEEWRQRLASSGLGSEDVRLVARAVESSREAYGSLSSCLLLPLIGVPLCVGGAVLAIGAISETAEGRSMAFACGSLFLAIAAAVTCWVVVRRRWADGVVAGVEPILVTALFPAGSGSVQGIQKSRMVVLKDRL